jgi:hypothetical protein
MLYYYSKEEDLIWNARGRVRAYVFPNKFMHEKTILVRLQIFIVCFNKYKYKYTIQQQNKLK